MFAFCTTVGRERCKCRGFTCLLFWSALF